MRRFVASLLLFCVISSLWVSALPVDGSVTVQVSQIDRWIATLTSCKNELTSLKSDNQALIAHLNEALNFLTKAREQFETAREMQYDSYLDWSSLVMDWTTRYESLKLQSEAEIARLKGQIKWLKIGIVTVSILGIGGTIAGFIYGASR
ncbi:hypothetical protein AGMMS49944_08930 [Spirochaetia bacterium]|nr:hypothetical protein AGMMS49944_08930 [Spirochaetia bacterium]